MLSYLTIQKKCFKLYRESSHEFIKYNKLTSHLKARGHIMEYSKSDESKLTIYVCLGSSCHLKGAYKVVEKLKESLTDPRVELRGSLCMGNCSEGVNVRVGDICVGNISLSNVESLIEKIKESLNVINGSKESR